MSKRSKNKKKQKNKFKNLSYSSFEKCLIEIEKNKKALLYSESDLVWINRLLSFERARGYLTDSQLTTLKRIVYKKQNAKKKTDIYYLYAISNGEHVKLGISTNPKGRKNTLSTGSPKPLKLEWSIPLGDDRAWSYQQEKKLHRFCKEHKVRGEWFGVECLKMVASFKPKFRKTKAEIIDEELDEDCLASCPF